MLPARTQATINLDRLTAKHAQAIIVRTRQVIEGDSLARQEKAKEVDNTLTKTLGVLQENGLYACVLFLTSRTDAERGRATIILDELLNLLTNLGFSGWEQKPDIGVSADILAYISNIVTINLSRLLLAKESCEQLLIYARYGAKARASEEGNGG